MKTTKRDIRALMKRYPLLNGVGHGEVRGYDLKAARAELLAPTFPREVDACRGWLREHTRPVQAINRRAGNSYSLKHQVESVAGHYVRNGAFIMAALLEGYQMDRGFNPCFNIGKPRRSKQTPSTSTLLTTRRRRLG